MDKYTILLVDDEEEVIQAIIRKINWEELGFSVVGYADNGIKALEIVYFLSLYAYPKLIGGAVTDTYINSSVPSFNKP